MEGPERLWGSPSLPSNEYRGGSPWGQSGQGVELTIHLHLLSKSRMELYLHSPYVFMTWCLIKLRDKFTFKT
jgi:hypothetical protein